MRMSKPLDPVRGASDTQRVLRTPLLLALACCPPFWRVGWRRPPLRVPHRGLGLVVFLGGAFGFLYSIEKTKNSRGGGQCCGFHLFMGLMPARMIG